ncbi:WxL domain-containing protein [Vagococcus sp. BWB3-3]|uniref:WxL domain-containing protein n=1 Tax=Vagococcus allomyrinae TaxID=2794353 RepID=A0A940P8V5_9ENTE|nr:WxL domain-containing protein [Vagococcus allomyrinae]MBP1040082.1 WxL domain-containing protein [Vagococcus allomyrinae]
MKKRLLLAGLSICAATVLGVTQADATSTEGVINFKTSTDQTGELIKPDTEDEVITSEDGNFSTGLLRLQFVPNFNFLEQEIKVGPATYNPKMTTYQYADVAKPGDQAIPQFVQVTDSRGLNEGWTLDVHATEFASATNSLEFAQIEFTQSKLFNTVYDNVNSRVSAFDGEATAKVSLDSAAKTRVLATNDNTSASTTNGSQTSLVFNNDYDKEQTYGLTDTNPGVKFIKTNKDTPVAGEQYKSTITWTLTAGI